LVPVACVKISAEIDVLASVVVPVTNKLFANVLSPAKVCVVVETSPRAVSEAFGMINE
jgi:hypothetical protein